MYPLNTPLTPPIPQKGLTLSRKVEECAPLITGMDIPMPYAANLEQLALPKVADIVRVAKRVCYRNMDKA